MDISKWLICRCCGKEVPPMDTFPIHTMCFGKHWSKHRFGINASRCKEFSRGKR